MASSKRRRPRAPAGERERGGGEEGAWVFFWRGEKKKVRRLERSRERGPAARRRKWFRSRRRRREAHGAEIALVKSGRIEIGGSHPLLAPQIPINSPLALEEMEQRQSRASAAARWCDDGRGAMACLDFGSGGGVDWKVRNFLLFNDAEERKEMGAPSGVDREFRRFESRDGSFASRR